MNHAALENGLGYRFRDPSLLALALTHPSRSGVNNQRLEFLGDAVLELAMSDILYRQHPRDEEGSMTFLRAGMVREETLFAVAEKLDLGHYIEMDKGCEASGGRTRPAVLADAMEAVLAAVYLDSGFGAALDIVRRLWPRESELAIPVTDNKSALQAYLQGRGLPPPEYALVSRTGPSHLSVFTMAVLVNGTVCGRGMGNSKKKAEQAAAGQALTALRAEEEKTE